MSPLAARVWAFFLSYHLLFGLGFAIVLGVVAPAPGKAVGKAPFSVANLMVVFIFLFAGVKLKTNELKNAVRFPKPLLLGVVLILLITQLLGFAVMGLRCQLEIEQNPKTLCRCQSKEEATAMVSRAFPAMDLIHGDGMSLVTEFEENCTKDYQAAIVSMVSSLAFAVRK